ncbi:hypothetical protein T439DRAFT_382149 [Meredithblackwellia eburnea MCA 4105]
MKLFLVALLATIGAATASSKWSIGAPVSLSACQSQSVSFEAPGSKDANRDVWIWYTTEDRALTPLTKVGTIPSGKTSGIFTFKFNGGQTYDSIAKLRIGTGADAQFSDSFILMQGKSSIYCHGTAGPVKKEKRF